MNNRELLEHASEAIENGKASTDEDQRAHWFAVADAWLDTASRRREATDNP